MRMFKRTLFVGLAMLLFGCEPVEQAQLSWQEEYKNGLAIERIPTKSTDLKPFGFSDNGAWHGYSLPPKDSTQYWGGFVGPLTMKLYGKWMSKSLMVLRLKKSDGTLFKIDENSYSQNYLPGCLQQKFKAGNLLIKQKLVFADNRTALITIDIENVGKERMNVTPSWEGDILLKDVQLKLADEQQYVALQLKDGSFVQLNFDAKLKNVELDKQQFHTELTSIDVKAGKKVLLTYSQSYFFNSEEAENKKEAIAGYLRYPNDVLANNKERWNGYLQKTITAIDDSAKQKLAVKALQTLISNWRSPAGDLKHNGIFPSAAYHGFYGFWSWDTWKHSVALAKIHPELAKDGIRSMFDYQNEAGMVADCIYFDLKENNWRDTKAPLAAWSVWKVFEATSDTAFVQELYPKVLKYHNWWYIDRDRDKNGICEYGSTDGTLVAAKWESGMDNAVRFDDTKIAKIHDTAWSFNQESVDLNAYLQKEKDYLAKMARLLNKRADAIKLEVQSRELKDKIVKYFWNQEKGYFFDINMDTKKPIETFGPEGWTLLWTKAAGKQQAEEVIQVMLNEKHFNTLVPFPTLDANHVKFNPLRGYWRGPVWLDQAYFGIQALKQYGYNKEAEALSHKLLHNSEGLMQKAPIRENYHPLSGKGLNANHFSWSAAHLLMLLKEK
ncbi:glycoside hydrolase [Prolixibacteraceae bacterium JC049]|nr:glycoside hydrolase [Prolixibacteraceae bacterium JC049]